jgi:hypothetical protein
VTAALERGARWLLAMVRTRAATLEPPSRALALFGLACGAMASEEALAIAGELAQSLASEDVAASAFVLRRALRVLPRDSDAFAHLAPGLGNEPSPPPLTWLPVLEDDTFPYVAPAELVRGVATSIGLETAFGERPHRWPEALGDALTFWAFCCMKDDDLDLLCPVTRALAYAGLQKTEEYGEAIDFILRHQRDDGRFSAQELSVANYAAANEGFDAVRDAWLPLTAGAMWTLRGEYD